MRIFFYGLFMDRTLLTEKGLHPVPVGPAVLPGYRIQIGERATLVPSPSSRVYGVVMELSDQEAHALYAEPSVRSYEPERVRVVLSGSDEVVEAYCYKLPPEADLTGTNPAYAKALSRLVEDLGLDAVYAREVAAFGS